MNDGLLTLLGWLGVALAAAAVIVYFIVLFQRPGWPRLLNGSGLFFAGMALSQAPFILRNTPDVRWNIVWAVVFLILSVIAQSVAALRNRKSWDGRDRRIPEPWDQSVERRGEQP